MYVFIDESFRENGSTGRRVGVLGALCVPDDQVATLQQLVYAVRRPYHDVVLGEHQELKAKQLLSRSTRRAVERDGVSVKWSLAEDLVNRCMHAGFSVAGVVSFDDGENTFLCHDEHSLDRTLHRLIQRLGQIAQARTPDEQVLLVFDDRGHRTNKRNAMAITNYLVKSKPGRRSPIVPYPVFAVSEAHNYPLQVADLVTAIIAMHYNGDAWIEPLWRVVRAMTHRSRRGVRTWTSIAVLREKEKASGGPEGPMPA
jgi:hypothetical protein